MLPVMTLDDERFEAITDAAKKMIARLYPTWTDQNLHDPGITFIELFAWLKELQQYHLDQIQDENLVKYLKILGEKPTPKRPAGGYVELSKVEKAFLLPKGTRFLAGETVFESVESSYISDDELLFCHATLSDEIPQAHQGTLQKRGMLIHAFTEHPEPDAKLYLGFRQIGEGEQSISLFVDIYNNYPVCRNPIDPNRSFAPLANIRWEYWDGEGWVLAELMTDQTYGLLFSGVIRMRLPCAPQPIEGVCWLRGVLLWQDYEVAPIITGLHHNAVEVTQIDTVAGFDDFSFENEEQKSISPEHLLATEGKTELFLHDGIGWKEWETFQVFADPKTGLSHFRVGVPAKTKAVRIAYYQENFARGRRVGEGDGFPNQEFSLYESSYLAEGFHLMVQEDDHWQDWTQVESFDYSAPRDRHFVFDEVLGCIRFGDCERGVAPKGSILILAAAKTLGKEGSVKQGRIDRIGRYGALAQVSNPQNMPGGANRESLAESFLRAKAGLGQEERAITYADYERLARQTPGLMVKACKAIAVTKIPRLDGSMDENCVSVVVQPYTRHGVKQLGAGYVENLYRQLEDRHLLGTRVNLLSPEYVEIDIFSEVLIKPYYVDAEQRIERAVEDFFTKATWDFGQSVLYSNIYGIIDTLDCVSEVKSLTINAKGKGITRSVNGDVLIPPNGICYLSAAEYVITAAE